jgi:hypothetical protein
MMNKSCNMQKHNGQWLTLAISFVPAYPTVIRGSNELSSVDNLRGSGTR